ncbi:unnamed protein product, partial [Mesorhabditis spiculigera]
MLAREWPVFYGKRPARDFEISYIHAELFELSVDGSKWVLVEPRLLYVTVHTSTIDDSTRVTATTAAGRSVVESKLSSGSKVERISECFVFWRDATQRTLAVNTLSSRS